MPLPSGPIKRRNAIVARITRFLQIVAKFNRTLFCGTVAKEPLKWRRMCPDKNDSMVKITLGKNGEQVVATRYQRYLPTENDLITELTRERENAERRPSHEVNLGLLCR